MSGTALEELIKPNHPAGLCPICDNAIEDSEPWLAICVHGVRWLIHDSCHPDRCECKCDREATVDPICASNGECSRD